jgi:dienelactone hydrolase
VRQAFLFIVLTFGCRAEGAPAASYDLKPGDHLVFRQVQERDVRSPEYRVVTHNEWKTHVLVLAQRGDRLLVGVQRNREKGELVRYEEGGRDLTARERGEFEAELAKRGRVFSEANRVTALGQRLLPWAALRESPSEVLPSVYELPPLPPVAGAKWVEPALFALELEPSAEGECLRVSGHEGTLRASYSVCGGALESYELEATYDTPFNRRAQERISLARLERRRGEGVAAWLDDADLRDGVVTAWLVAEAPPFPESELRARLGRDAAFDTRLDHALERFAPALPQQPEDAALAPIAQAVFGTGSVPEWGCAVPDRAARGLRARRAPLQVPGTTLRQLRSPGVSGRAYVLHVPEAYRGDRPWPLVIVLAGGAGRALPMAQGLRDTLAGMEAVVAMPDAHSEMWWDERPTQAFGAMLTELFQDLNLDPNRVTLTGFSNGGTGSLYYATLWPDRFAAIAPLMGAGTLFFQSSEPLLLKNVTTLPMLFLHGDKDPIIPPAGSLDTVKALRRAAPDAPVSLEILKGRGHDVTATSDEGRSLAFLKDKRREPFPRRISFATRRPARRDWVEVVKKKGGAAEVEASIGADDVVRVTTRRVESLKLLLRSELFSPGARKVAVEIDGRRRFEGPLVEDCGVLAASWRETQDPFRAWTTELAFDVER